MALGNVVRLFDEDQPPAAEATATRFEEVWKLWPNKAKKPLAKAKYLSIIKGNFVTRTLDKDSGLFVAIEVEGTEEQVVAGIKAYLKSQIDTKTYRMKDDGKYIPMLSTFLNQGRFMDHE